MLPSLYSEIQNPKVLDNITNEIQKVRYLNNVVVALGGAPEEAQFEEAKEYFARLRSAERNVKVVWVDGPRIQKVFREIQSREISTGIKGKGQSVWITLGYLFAKKDSDVIALHDCAIVTYDRILLGRLIEPAANPNNDFEFCKGYYLRISPTEREMKGRVTRLFLTPFVDMILHTYYDNALNFVKSYSDDAEANALQFDRYKEEQTVRYFRGFLWTAWEQSKGPHRSTLIPSWNRVAFSLPDIYPKILKAVEADNK